MVEQGKVDEWFRKEVLSNKDRYPNLYNTEIRKNQFKFEQEGRK